MVCWDRSFRPDCRCMKDSRMMLFIQSIVFTQITARNSYLYNLEKKTLKDVPVGIPKSDLLDFTVACIRVAGQ